MKALICDVKGNLSIEEVPMPKYNSKQALVKIVACGICGTDVKLIHANFNGITEDMYPLMLGHEGIGEVVKIGDEVKGLNIGDKVIIPFIDHSPKDFNGYGSAWGAFSEYAIVNDALAYPNGEAPHLALAQNIIPNDIDPIDAVILVTFREVLSAIYFFGIKPQDNAIAIFGCGPVGLTFIKFLSIIGVKNIIAIDRNDHKLKSAKEHGATMCLHSENDDIAKSVKSVFPNGINYVIDAIGLQSVANTAMEILEDRGKVLCYGVLGGDKLTIDFSKMSYNWSFVSQQYPRKDEEAAVHDEIIGYIREGKLVMKDFISDYFKFEDSVQAFDKYLNKQVAKKGIIVY